jgi:membrane fusion protein, multidrug efflux system
VQVGQQGPYVYVVKADHTAEQRAVEPGQRQGENLVIDKGVAAGETVIKTGQLMVVPGGAVNVIEGPGAAAPTTAPSTEPSAGGAKA